MDARTAEELFIKYGRPDSPLFSRTLMFNFLHVLKKNPNHDNVAWAVHSEHADKWVWQHFWDALDFFLWKLVMRLVLKGG